MKKLYFVVGEASGDLHASNLVKSLNQQASGIEMRGWGGDLMQEQGVEIVKHYRELAFMGFAEVIMNLRTILNNIKKCKEDIANFKPDAVVLVDYPGFNLRIASWAKSNGIKVFYYVSPQVWAWKSNRYHKIKRDVDELFCILPFEKDWYAERGVDVNFVGHPLLDAVDSYNRPAGLKVDKPVLAVLPGSRQQELTKMLPEMVEAATGFKEEYDIILAAAPSTDLDWLKAQVPDYWKIIQGRTYDILSVATVAMVTSGTATLETALFNVPQVVCYRANSVSYQIAKRLVKINYISLVNLIMDKEVVKELIQSEMNSERIAKEVAALLPGQPGRDTMINSYTQLKTKLGGSGASARVASIMLKSLGIA